MIKLYKIIRKWLCLKYEWHEPNGTLFFEFKDFKPMFQESVCKFCKQEIHKRSEEKWHSVETIH